MSTKITRVGWCSACYKAGRPHYDNFFVAWGSHGWHVMLAKRMGRAGFTPHIYRLIKVIGENVIYESICAMHDCGVEVFHVPAKNSYNFRLGEWERGMMELKQWNNLVLLKDTGYEV